MLLQRLALAAFCAVVVLLFIGAVVRATGSGLGCPDWPFCYGRAFPPSSAEEIDFTHLNLEKFRQKAAQHGRDPATITPETIRAEFNPTHTWIEYLNRLSSTPVALAILAFLVAAIRSRKHYKTVHVAAWIAFALLIFNAWLGAKVVYSGLQPGNITLHMAATIVLLCVLVYAAWRAAPVPWGLEVSEAGRARFPALQRLAQVLFLLVLIEGVMGSQVREMTDQLAIKHAGQPRIQWTAELEETHVYLVHRSASWFITAAALLFWHHSRTVLARGAGRLERGILGLVLGQMFLGLILSQVGVVPTAQILHIGLSSLLVSGLFLWLLGSSRVKTHV